MSNAKELYVTVNGFEDMKKELDNLKLVRRPEVILALKDARSLGDLSENAEYDAARNEQAEVENRIKELEGLIDNSKIIREINTDTVGVGTKVKLEYVEDGDFETYEIVGRTEADPFLNKISNESPIAQAIMGLKVGKVVTVNSPNGKYDIKIIEIF